MNVFLYLNADATIYKHKDINNLNTGLDEILELENTYDELTCHHVSRFLVKFELNDSNIPNTILLSSEYFLNFKITESCELKHETTIQTFPIKGPWSEGAGRRYDTEVAPAGVTWKSKTEQGDPWEEEGGVWHSYKDNSDGSITEIGSEYQFSKRTSDVSMDITDIVKDWILGTMENNGLIVKFKNEMVNHQGKVSFFSKDTNTIYSPYLRICYDDYYFDPCKPLITSRISCLYNEVSGSIDLVSGSTDLISGSGDTSAEIIPNSVILRTEEISQSTIKHITSEDIVITLKGLKSKISITESMRIKVGVREKYPQKTFSSHSDYTSDNYVDYPMYFSVRDADTHEVRIPFGKYSFALFTVI